MPAGREIYRIDGNWIKRQIEDNGFSMREFARRVNMDIAVVSRTIAGIRKLQVHEARLWARALCVLPEEIFMRMGVKLGAPGAPEATLTPGGRAYVPPVAGKVDAETGVVSFKPTPISRKTDIVALTIEGHPFMAGWRVFYSQSGVSTGEDADLGLIYLPKGKVLLRKLRPGATPGHFDLALPFGQGEILADVKPEAVLPVLGMGGIRVRFYEDQNEL